MRNHRHDLPADICKCYWLASQLVTMMPACVSLQAKEKLLQHGDHEVYGNFMVCTPGTGKQWGLGLQSQGHWASRALLF
jgi:hypothetical protein